MEKHKQIAVSLNLWSHAHKAIQERINYRTWTLLQEHLEDKVWDITFREIERPLTMKLRGK
jgi:hypothetical protein